MKATLLVVGLAALIVAGCSGQQPATSEPDAPIKVNNVEGEPIISLTARDAAAVLRVECTLTAVAIIYDTPQMIGSYETIQVVETFHTQIGRLEATRQSYLHNWYASQDSRRAIIRSPYEVTTLSVNVEMPRFSRDTRPRPTRTPILEQIATPEFVRKIAESKKLTIEHGSNTATFDLAGFSDIFNLECR